MNEKKDLGVVFTPKIIAFYMSKTIIYNYLLNKYHTNYNKHYKKEHELIIKNFVFNKKIIKNLKLKNQISILLKNIKILEPSVGEGILIVEFLKLLLSLLDILEGKKTELNKLTIEISLYEINKNYLKQAKYNIGELIKNTSIKIKSLNEDFLKFNLEKRINEKFDIIIANPPYVKEKEHKELFLAFKYTEYYQARMDIWYLFLQYSIDLLKPDGVITYIIPNNWTTSSGAKKLRDSIFNKTQIMSIVDFKEYNVFKTAAIQTMILSLKKVKSSISEYEYNYLEKSVGDNLEDFLSHSNTNKISFNNKLSYLIFTSQKINNLLNKIANSSNFKLIKIKELSQGIIHPQNAISKSNLTIMKDTRFNEGVFVVSKVEKENLKLNNLEKKILKPTYKTKELKKYFNIAKAKFWTIYTDKSFNKNDKINKYPNIKKHLDKFNKIMTSDYKPYGLHRTRNEYFFKKGAKILVARKSLIPTFTYLEDECYPTFTFNVIKSDRIDLKYLTVLLNSKLIAFYLKYQGKMQGKHFQIDIAPLLNLPIVNNKSKYSILNEKLNVLLEEKKATKKQINELDNIIYLIYGLNREEIDIIESDIEVSHGKHLKT